MEERTIEITLQEYTELLQCKLHNETIVKLLEMGIFYTSSSADAAIKAILTGDTEVNPEKTDKEEEEVK